MFENGTSDNRPTSTQLNNADDDDDGEGKDLGNSKDHLYTVGPVHIHAVDSR